MPVGLPERQFKSHVTHNHLVLMKAVNGIGREEEELVQLRSLRKPAPYVHDQRVWREARRSAVCEGPQT